MDHGIVWALFGYSTPWIAGLLLVYWADQKEKGNGMGIDMGSVDNRAMIALFLMVLVGSGGGGYVNSVVNDPRPDPFTGTQGEQLKADFYHALELHKREQALQLKEIESSIREDMPPTPTRARVRAIEQYLQQTGQENGRDFEPPTYEWH